MTNVVVPDASVILKWVLPATSEKYLDNALKIRDMFLGAKLQLKVPPLWLYEAGNMLSRDLPDYAEGLLHTLISFGLKEASWNQQWLTQCLSIVQHYKVTFYDAAYHSLALVEEGIFVTADDQYVKKTHALGAIKRLSDWY